MKPFTMLPSAQAPLHAYVQPGDYITEPWPGTEMHPGLISSARCVLRENKSLPPDKEGLRELRSPDLLSRQQQLALTLNH